jgi:hypothetical protein
MSRTRKPSASTDFESFIRTSYNHLNVEQVVELRDYTRIVLVDEGDFDGLTDFVTECRRRFNATVELRRESTKSFQLEVLLPHAGVQLAETGGSLPVWREALVFVSLIATTGWGVMALASLFRP